MRFLRSQPPPEVPADAAIWWATCRQIDPVRFANERAAFSAWLADEINASAWQEVDRRVEMVVFCDHAAYSRDAAGRAAGR